MESRPQLIAGRSLTAFGTPAIGVLRANKTICRAGFGQNTGVALLRTMRDDPMARCANFVSPADRPIVRHKRKVPINSDAKGARSGFARALFSELTMVETLESSALFNCANSSSGDMLAIRCSRAIRNSRGVGLPMPPEDQRWSVSSGGCCSELVPQPSDVHIFYMHGEQNHDEIKSPKNKASSAMEEYFKNPLDGQSIYSVIPYTHLFTTAYHGERFMRLV